MQQHTQLVRQKNHNQFLIDSKKAIYRGRIGMIILPFIGFICSKCEYIPTNKIFLVCVIYLLMCSWENKLDKAIAMVEEIYLKKTLNGLGDIRNNIRVAILVQRMFIVMFIILGTFFANDGTIYAKNNIIIFFVVSVIIEFILNPLSKVLKLLEDNMTKEPPT